MNKIKEVCELMAKEAVSLMIGAKTMDEIIRAQAKLRDVKRIAGLLEPNTEAVISVSLELVPKPYSE